MTTDATMALGHDPRRLPCAPPSVVRQGEPATGRYEGCIGAIDWRGLSGPHHRPAWWRLLRRKRWQYVGIGSDEVFIGLAIVDLGWGCTAFAYVFDRRQRRLLADWSQDGARFMGGVGTQPVQGARAWFRGPGARLALDERGGVLQVRVDTRVLSIHADVPLAGAAPWLLAVGSVAGGVAHATQKSPALAVQGHVQVGSRLIDLSGASASVDSSSGLLAHRTDWRWASAHSPSVGFNLQAGYFGACENALWLDGQLIPLGAARFGFEAARPLAPWRVSTDCGLLDLLFTPEGARHDRRDLGLVASRYVQPVGTFSGVVKAAPGAPPRRVEGLLGVTEGHASRW